MERLLAMSGFCSRGFFRRGCCQNRAAAFKKINEQFQVFIRFRKSRGGIPGKIFPAKEAIWALRGQRKTAPLWSGQPPSNRRGNHFV
jgi:hypothetical protein